MFKEVYLNCAGLDVHKKFLIACRLTVDAQGETHSESRTFGAMTPDLEADYLDQLDKERITRRLVKRLEALGFAVALTEREEAQAVPQTRSATETLPVVA